MKPRTRIEMYLAALANDEDAVSLPAPITRVEMYLAKIAGETVTLPETPITRIEMYLAKIAGEDVTIRRLIVAGGTAIHRSEDAVFGVSWYVPRSGV